MILERSLDSPIKNEMKIICDLCLENEDSISCANRIETSEGSMGKSEVVSLLVGISGFHTYPLSFLRIFYICPNCYPINKNNLEKLLYNPIHVLNWNSRRFIEKDHHWELIGTLL